MRGNRLLSWLGLVVGLALGLALSFLPSALASRNASGTYTLPNSPVVSGSVISSSSYNSTLSDLKTEMTDSLSRSGKGPMLAPMEATNGTVSLPSITFDSDPDTGLYRIGANNLGLACNGAKVLDVATTGVSVTGQVTATMNPATDGYGVLATGGLNRNGVRGISSDSVAGVYGTSTSGGVGVQGVGGGTAAGGQFSGGASNGYGVTGDGTGTKEGGVFTCGTAATGGTRQDAVTLTNGDLNLTGVADPTSTTSISDRLTPVSFVKAWAKMTSVAGTVTVNGGVNITSAACASNEITVTIAADFANTSYGASVLLDTSGAIPFASNQTAGTFTVGAKLHDGTTVDLCSGTKVLHFMAIGAQ